MRSTPTTSIKSFGRFAAADKDSRRRGAAKGVEAGTGAVAVVAHSGSWTVDFVEVHHNTVNFIHQKAQNHALMEDRWVLRIVGEQGHHHL